MFKACHYCNTLQQVLGQSATDKILKCPEDHAHQVEATKEGFTSLINADPALLRSQLDEYVAKLNEKKEQTCNFILCTHEFNYYNVLD